MNGALSILSNVFVKNPINGQIIEWNATSNTWQNSTPAFVVPKAMATSSSTENIFWYPTIPYSSHTTFASTGNALYAIPYYFDATHDVSTLGYLLQTQGSAVNVELGIYADNGSLYPAALLFDSGSHPITANTYFTVPTGGITVGPGLVWFVSTLDVGTSSASLVAAVPAVPSAIGGFDPSNNSTAYFYGFEKANPNSFGTFPATFPSNSNFQSSSGLPLISFQLSS